MSTSVDSIQQVQHTEEAKNIERSKKYFLYKFFNYFLESNKNNLISKRTESFRFLMREIIEVHTEIRLAKNDAEVIRLNKALQYLFKELTFIIEHNPLFRHEKLIRDFSQIQSNLSQKKNKKSKDDEPVLNDARQTNIALTSLTSLNKKVRQSEIIDYHFDIILNQSQSLQFDKVDYLIDSLVNESLFMHSPKHLREWIDRYNKQYPYDGTDSDTYIEKLKDRFREENFQLKEFFFIHRILIPKSISEKVDLKQDRSLITPSELKERSKEIINFSKIENHLFPSKEGVFFIKRSIQSADKFKASDILVEKINRLFEVYKLIGERDGFEISPKGLYKDNSEKLWEFSDVLYRNEITSDKITYREEEDIKDFIEIRNKKLINGVNNELFLLERAYSLISNSKELTLENQLLNNWLAIEHMVTPYICEAIIEKVRQIIPKVVSLYYIKGRMNELWDEINDLQRNESDDFLEGFLNDCRKNESLKYDKTRFGEKLKSIDIAEQLIEVAEGKGKINIVRITMELNGMLNNFDSTKKKVKYINGLIENDLNRIYRIRNKIVHSGINVPENLNLISLRLLNYNNRLMGTIIHYMKDRDNIKIEDVLNSIVETYNWYVEEKTVGLSLKEIITPEYLYL